MTTLSNATASGVESSPATGSFPPSILTLNGGSSSIRFALFEEGVAPRRRFEGKVERIGLSETKLTFKDTSGSRQGDQIIDAGDSHAAVAFLLDWLETQKVFTAARAVGHRVVHGMAHSMPERVTPELLDELRRITPYDPEHLPLEIELMESILRRHPSLVQVACFDTAFHRTMPRVATQLPVPRRYAEKGVERYGFHGLSCAWLMEELRRLDPAAAKGRVILAHLGNGASMTAVRGGKSIDTSMGFTPAAGLMMSTRTGDIDPGLAYFLMRSEGMTAEQFQTMVNHESGLLGVSETSSDMRDLLLREVIDIRAAEAVALFCYQARKWTGSLAAALGGVDTLVFAGGIGENAPSVRERICDGLGFLGIEVDASRNAESAAVISTEGSRATVRVIRTDEEQMIAKSVTRLLKSLLKNPDGSRHE